MAKVEQLRTPTAPVAAEVPVAKIDVPAFDGGNAVRVIAAAMHNIKTEIRKLSHDERNEHGGYRYASIDAFYDMLRPIMTAQGLTILMDEDSAELKEYTDGRGAKALYQIKFTFQFMHQSGAVWPEVGLARTVTVAAGGAQSWGQAASYAMKHFARSIFQISTGEPDADAAEPVEIVAKPTTGMSVVKSRAMASLFVADLASAKTPAEIDALFTRAKSEGAAMQIPDKQAVLDAYRDAIKRVMPPDTDNTEK